MKLSPNLKTYLTSFFATLVIIFLVICFFVTDYRCRSSLTNVDKPIFEIEEYMDKTYLNVYTLGIDESLDVTVFSDLWEGFLKFICFPVH